MALIFGTSPDGSKASVDKLDSSSFYHDGLEEHLLVYFVIDGVTLCEGGKFSGSQLDTLISRLDAGAKWVGAQEQYWPFGAGKRYEFLQFCWEHNVFVERSGGPINHYLPECYEARDAARRILETALALAIKAKARNEYLVFYRAT